jgi:hypothetical protein
MGKGFAILFSVLLLLAATTVNASIVGWNCADDGDGAIVMGSATWTVVDPVLHDYDLSMSGAQYRSQANVAGDFTTDNDLDPSVRIIEDIDNDASFAWTDYHITMGMSHNFSFVTAGLVMPDGWTATVSAVTAGIIPNGGNGWVGTIDYVNDTGDAIAIGDTGEFGFKVSFSGSTSFCTEQNPTPEPATIGLLGLGAMALLRRRKA